MEKKEIQADYIENKICSIIGRLLITRYNWSLVLTTILIWVFGGAIFGYSANANFDMSVLLNEYTKVFSLFAIGVGFFFSLRRSYFLVGLGIGSYLISLASQIMSKTLVLNGAFGALALKPLSIFCLMLILKNMWILAVDREINNMSQ